MVPRLARGRNNVQRELVRTLVPVGTRESGFGLDISRRVASSAKGARTSSRVRGLLLVSVCARKGSATSGTLERLGVDRVVDGVDAREDALFKVRARAKAPS